jgi:hypothetical protein
MIHSQNNRGKIIVESDISSYADAEYARFCNLLNRALIKANMDMRGNRHAQAQHDGVALKDHCKYQSLALNFSLEDTNWTAAFAFCKSAMMHDGTNQGVAQLFKTKFKAAPGLEAHTVCRRGGGRDAARGFWSRRLS